MSFPDLLEEIPDLADGVRGKLTPNQPLSAVTWFRTGGPAQLMFQPADEDDLAVFLKKLPKDIPVLPVGLGSNLLIRDGGLKGVVVRSAQRALARSRCLATIVSALAPLSRTSGLRKLQPRRAWAALRFTPEFQAGSVGRSA
jgi:UDP-N-acetylenolpyruvoylglucosamine reductase